jgi:hypothetical protein
LIRKTALYQVKTEACAVVEAAVREFVTAVARSEPQTEYVALRLEDGVSFMHLMGFPSPEAEQQHQSADYTRRFVSALTVNCIAEPKIAKFEQITP